MTRYERYNNKLSLQNKLARFFWGVVFVCLFRPFYLPFFNKWRIILLRMFGAKIGSGCKIAPTLRVWAPWNLEIGHRTALGPYVECYNPGKIIIGNKVTISQRAHLCAASHDYTKKENPLITKPITIKDYCWIAADAFVSMGVTAEEGSIVAARAVVVKDVKAWTIVAGNPAKLIKNRVLK